MNIIIYIFDNIRTEDWYIVSTYIIIWIHFVPRSSPNQNTIQTIKNENKKRTLTIQCKEVPREYYNIKNIFIHIRYGFISSVSIYLLLLIINSIIFFIRCYCCYCSPKELKKMAWNSVFFFLFLIPSLRQIVVLPGVEKCSFNKHSFFVVCWSIWQSLNR